MPLLRLALKPGIDKQNTEYGAEGGWTDCDYVRFQYGLPEKTGGWIHFNDEAQYLIGMPSEVFTWNALNGVPYSIIGTDRKLYAFINSGWVDVTPIRYVDPTVSFDTIDTSNLVTVNSLVNGATPGDFVTFTNVTGTPGGIPNASLNQEFEIQNITGDNTYTILSPVPATATATAAGTAEATYQISVGSDLSYFNYGWGTATWGLSTWGTPRESGTTKGKSLLSRVWQFDSYGENVICQLVNGGTYIWEIAGGVVARAHQIAGAPTNSTYALVSTPDRHLVCFGTETIIGDDTSQDPMYVRFSNQEDIGSFDASAINTAGGQRLNDGSRIVSAVRSRGQILIFTDTSLHGMQYVGPPYTFGFSQLGSNCGCIGPHAAVDVNGVAMWMGVEAFYVFDGTVKKIACTVQDYVFKDINLVQSQKVHVGVNSQFNEVTWWYCSFTEDYIDRYVSYNYLENTWSIGTMPRSAWVDVGTYSRPLATEYFYDSDATPVDPVQGLTNGRCLVYTQETGKNAIDLPIRSYLRSGYFDIGDGDNMVFMKRFIPDFKNFVGDLTIHILLRAFPSAPASTSSLDPYIITPTTQKVDTRARGRQLAISMENETHDGNWRFGTLRVDIQPDGLR